MFNRNFDPLNTRTAPSLKFSAPHRPNSPQSRPMTSAGPVRPAPRIGDDQAEAPQSGTQSAGGRKLSRGKMPYQEIVFWSLQLKPRLLPFQNLSFSLASNPSRLQTTWSFFFSPTNTSLSTPRRPERLTPVSSIMSASYTIADVQQHKTEADGMWLIVENNVYDITSM